MRNLNDMPTEIIRQIAEELYDQGVIPKEPNLTLTSWNLLARCMGMPFFPAAYAERVIQSVVKTNPQALKLALVALQEETFYASPKARQLMQETIARHWLEKTSVLSDFELLHPSSQHLSSLEKSLTPFSMALVQLQDLKEKDETKIAPHYDVILQSNSAIEDFIRRYQKELDQADQTHAVELFMDPEDPIEQEATFDRLMTAMERLAKAQEIYAVLLGLEAHALEMVEPALIDERMETLVAQALSNQLLSGHSRCIAIGIVLSALSLVQSEGTILKFFQRCSEYARTHESLEAYRYEALENLLPGLKALAPEQTKEGTVDGQKTELTKLIEFAKTLDNTDLHQSETIIWRLQNWKSEPNLFRHVDPPIGAFLTKNRAEATALVLGDTIDAKLTGFPLLRNQIQALHLILTDAPGFKRQIQSMSETEKRENSSKIGVKM
jgi:hypothetical protein